MSRRELEELVISIRQFIQKARNQNDAFEYYRLCEELNLAQAALADMNYRHLRRIAPATHRKAPMLFV